MEPVFRLSKAVSDLPAVHNWFQKQTEPLACLAKEWLDCICASGDDLLVQIHDGCPAICLGDAPFCYVNAFKAHVNIGFYYGAFLTDPENLLLGKGKRMRHIKLRPEAKINQQAIRDLIQRAYQDLKNRLKQTET